MPPRINDFAQIIDHNLRPRRRRSGGRGVTDIPGTITVTVPFTIRHHGGRKQVITPDGRPALAPPRARVDSALVKALGRAFRWRRLLDTGAYATIEEVAAAEGISPSYVSRVLRMPLLGLLNDPA